jgi:hypothetical protein
MARAARTALVIVILLLSRKLIRSRERMCASFIRNAKQQRILLVTTGLDPVVHGDLRFLRAAENFAGPHFRMDCRVKPGNDETGKNEIKKGKRNADRRVSNRPRLTGAAACSAEHARLSAFHRGSSWGCRNISVQLQARLPGTRPPRLLC